MLLGVKIKKPNGVWEYSIMKKDKERIIENLKRFIQKLDKLAGKAIVVDDNDSVIITAYRKRN